MHKGGCVQRECACRSGKATTSPVGSLNRPCIAHHSLIQRQRRTQQRHPGEGNMVQKRGPVDGDRVPLLWTTAGLDPFLPFSSHCQCFCFKHHAIKTQSHSTVFTISVYKICIHMHASAHTYTHTSLHHTYFTVLRDPLHTMYTKRNLMHYL